MPKSGQMANAIQNAEHIGPNDTGDNIEAKRVAAYGFDVDANEWRRQAVTPDGATVVSTNRLVVGDFDTVTATYPEDDTEVYTYTLAAATVATVTVVYTDNTKELIASVTRL